MNPGVSVVICTYNGASLLPETIRHMAKQCVRSEIEWEIIIIDNASTDATSEVVRAEWQKHRRSVPFSIFHQPKQGLTYAREMGFKKSQYEFVLFCDDDNWLNSDYVNLAYDLMLKHSSIGVLGGFGELIFETPPPQWALRLSIFANGPQEKASGKVKRNLVHGASCVVRKSAFEKIKKKGIKLMLTDRKGRNLTAGGDFEICYAIALAGYDIWYEEKLRFKHFMPKYRISTDYYIRLVKEGMQSFEVLIPYRIRLNNGSTNILSFHLMLSLILLSYVIKFLKVCLLRLMLLPGSEEILTNKLKRISLQSKILTVKGYPKMKKNFFKTLKYGKTEYLHDLKIGKKLNPREKILQA